MRCVIDLRCDARFRRISNSSRTQPDDGPSQTDIFYRICCEDPVVVKPFFQIGIGQGVVQHLSCHLSSVPLNVQSEEVFYELQQCQMKLSCAFHGTFWEHERNVYGD